MPAIGWEALPLLASYRFASSLANSPVLTVPAVDLLQVQFNVEGYSGSAIASLRFNGSTTITEYSSSYTTFSTAAPGVPVNTSGTFGGFKLGGNAVTVQRSGLVTIKNNNSTSHGITCQSQTHASTAGPPVSSFGSGMYISGSANQITTIQLIIDTGSITMPAGTSLAIFGMTPSS
jgi:hypothetical protein